MDNTFIEHSPYCDERNSFSSSEYNAGFSISLYIDGGVRSVAGLASLNKVLDCPFGTVRLAVRALVWALYQDGYPIECRPATRDTWSLINESRFDADTCYRVMPKAGMPVYNPTCESDDDFQGSYEKRRRMTDNQRLLAQIVAHHALLKASRADVRPQQGRAMEALSEAIEGTRDEVLSLVVTGKFETDSYRVAKNQLTKWTEAWNWNR